MYKLGLGKAEEQRSDYQHPPDERKSKGIPEDHLKMTVQVSCTFVSNSAIPGTVARQAPLSLELSRQEYWSGLPFPSSGIFPAQRSNLGLLHCRQFLYHLRRQGSPEEHILLLKYYDKHHLLHSLTC